MQDNSSMLNYTSRPLSLLLEKFLQGHNLFGREMWKHITDCLQIIYAICFLQRCWWINIFMDVSDVLSSTILLMLTVGFMHMFHITCCVDCKTTEQCKLQVTPVIHGASLVKLFWGSFVKYESSWVKVCWGAISFNLEVSDLVIRYVVMIGLFQPFIPHFLEQFLNWWSWNNGRENKTKQNKTKS